MAQEATRTTSLPLGREVAPGAALLSPRGRVMEGPMPRFFRRLAEGVFDTQDVIRRAAELAAFVEAARAAYGIARPIALGFSNGANIAAATLLLHPQALAGAVLMRALAPVDPPSPPAAGRRACAGADGQRGSDQPRGESSASR